MIEVTSQLAVLYIRVFIPESHSLKDKRGVLKSLKDRVRSQFNVSVAELDCEDKWQTATIAFAMIGNDRRHMDSVMQNLLALIDSYHALQVCEHQLEFC